MEKQTNVKLEVGKRVLFHTSVSVTIFEGVIEEISSSGKLFKIGGRWYTTESSLIMNGPIQAEILDEFPGLYERIETLVESPGKPEEENGKSSPKGPS